jgi:hypothetical protein
MAYVDQSKKALIAAALKPVMPAGWKWSLAVQNHSTIVLTITSAPVDLLAEVKRVVDARAERRGEQPIDGKTFTNFDVNHYHLDTAFDGELLETFRKIVDALNTNNHDRSDIQSDHFDVGHYVAVKLGRWNKPFVVTK